MEVVKQLSRDVKVMYGVSEDRPSRLHDLFYNTKLGSLVHREDATVTIGTPFCGQCEQYVSTKEKGKTCRYCGKCPYCYAGLGVGVTTAGKSCKFLCKNCGYNTEGIIEIETDDVTDPTVPEELMKRVVEVKGGGERHFKELEQRLGDVVERHCNPKTPLQLPTERAMGMNRDKVKTLEAAIKARQDSYETHPIPPFESAENEATRGEVHIDLLPVPCPLLVRTAIRHQKYLLSAEMDGDGNRRLNRSATLLLPKVLVTPRHLKDISKGDKVTLPLTFINPSSFPCTVSSIRTVSQCNCDLQPPSTTPHEIGPVPETPQHTPRWSTADEPTTWDNNLTFPLTLEVARLEESHEKGEGLELCLEIVYKHFVDSTETETLVYLFVLVPFE